jgi:hypothetical protein
MNTDVWIAPRNITADYVVYYEWHFMSDGWTSFQNMESPRTEPVLLIIYENNNGVRG